MATGILLAVLSGVLWGVCFLPMRYTKQFAWENTWFIWAFTCCLLFPPTIAYFTIPDLLQVFREVGVRLNLIILGVGLVAGMSGICIGLGLRKVGMAITNSLSSGVALAVGAFVPLAVQHRSVLFTNVGLTLYLGLILAVAGVVICALAGSKRNGESAYASQSHQATNKRRSIILQGIVLAIVAGLLTPAQNFGMAFADTFMKVARAHGSSEAFMAFAFYIPYFGTSFVSNGIYCAWLWKKNNSLAQFREPCAVRFTALSVGMAALWIGGCILYGWAMPWMKTFGPVVAWPISMVTTNLTSAFVEYLYGDWEGKALQALTYGLVVLTIAIGIFGYSSFMIATAL
ncbi:MAG: L-rhamnose/proton symporter RhaT [Acidobacteriota bacterium]